jgi:hypothetical protein
MMDHRPTWQTFQIEITKGRRRRRREKMKKNDDDESDVDVHMICYIPCRIGDGSRVGIAGERRI